MHQTGKEKNREGGLGSSNSARQGNEKMRTHQIRESAVPAPAPKTRQRRRRYWRIHDWPRLNSKATPGQGEQVENAKMKQQNETDQSDPTGEQGHGRRRAANAGPDQQGATEHSRSS